MNGYTIGQTLVHEKLGQGTVTEVRTVHGNVCLTLDFPGVGTRDLLARYAPLTHPDGSRTLRLVASDFEAFDAKVNEAAGEMRVREAARALLAAEKAAADPAEPYDVGTLRELLERPPEPPMRIAKLLPSDASALVVAQRKTGKTTLTLNMARCLITGEPMLGCLETRPIEGNVAVLNFEVSAAMVARWGDEHGVDLDRLVVANMRGRRNPFASAEDRERLAQHLRDHDVEVLAVDPFGRAYTGKSQNDPGEVGAWLAELDAFARAEVGARELVLSTHAGWNGERTRGSTALEDWADSIITLTRDPDDESQRFIRSIGRMDDELEEDRLDFDPATRTLTLAGVGSRAKVKTDGKVTALAVLVSRAVFITPGLNTRELIEAVRDMPDAPSFQDRHIAKAARLAEQQGQVRIEAAGPGKPTRHFPTPSNPVQTPSTQHTPTPSNPVYMDGVGGGGAQQTNPVQAERG